MAYWWFTLDDDNNAVPTDDVLVWGKWFEEASRSGRRFVARTELDGGTVISTVFLGTNYNFSMSSDSVPLVFETMTFCPDGDEIHDRYATWAGAQAGHDQIVAQYRERLDAWGGILDQLEAGW